MPSIQSDPFHIKNTISSFHAARKTDLMKAGHTKLIPPAEAYPSQNMDDFRCGLSFYGARLVGDSEYISIRQTVLRLLTVENGRFVIGHGLDGMIIDNQDRVMSEPSCFCNHGLYNVSKRLPDLPYQELNDDVFLSFDGAARNYYHWLLYAVSKMQIAKRILPDFVKFIIPDATKSFATRNPAFSQEVFNSSLAVAGLSDRVTPLEDGIYRARRIHYLWHSPTMPELYLNMEAPHRLFDLFDVPHNPELPERFYVGRAMDGSGRITPDEQALIDPILEQEGYTKVFLEGMDFRTQVALFRQATSIIAPHGAGLANLVFSRKGTKLLELNRRLDNQNHLRNCFYLIAANRGIHYKFYNMGGSPITAERFLSALHA